MTFQRLRYSLLFLILFALFLISSCDKKSPVQTAGETQALLDVPDQIIIAYSSGDVTITDSKGSRKAVIGDSIPEGSRLTTGADGFVELQLGVLGAVRIDADSEYVLDTSTLGAGGGEVAGTLKFGILYAKIRKLSNTDAFETSASGTVCAVRGTAFLVRVQQDGPATVAVSEGSVAVLPPSLAMIGTAPESREALQKVAALMPSVGASEELTLSGDRFEEVETIVVSWTSGKSGSDPDEVAELTRLVEKAVRDIPGPRPISTENRDSLAERTPVVLAVPSSTVANVVPETAEKPVKTEAAVSVEPTSPVKAEARPASVSAVPETAIAAAAPAATVRTAAVRLQVSPPDAVILVDGIPAGVGSAVVEKPEGTQISVSAERPGYLGLTDRITVRSNDQTRSLNLEPLLIVSKAGLPGTATGYLSRSGNTVVGMTRNGELFAIDSLGRIQWTLATGNTENEGIFPLVAEGRVFVLGSDLIIASLADGRLIRRVELNNERAVRFGQRPAMAGNYLVLPGNRSLSIVNQTDGTSVKNLELAEGTLMSPAAWGSKVVISDQNGVLLMVNPDTMEIERRIPTESTQPVGHAAAVTRSGLAVFSGRRGLVSAVDLNSGNVLWTRNLVPEAGVRVTTDAVIHGKVAYVLGDNRLYALNLSNGKDQFPSIPDVTVPPLITGKNMLICRRGGIVTVHNTVSGVLVGEIPLGENITSRPIEINGLVFAAGERSAFIIDPRSITQ